MVEEEREPILIRVGITHCKGSTSKRIPYNTKEIDLIMTQLLMSNEHDKIVHKENDPHKANCKKSFFRE
jgi:hypothetical protein